MEVHLTEDQRAFIREAVKTARLQFEEDAVRQAMLFGKSASGGGLRSSLLLTYPKHRWRGVKAAP